MMKRTLGIAMWALPLMLACNDGNKAKEKEQTAPSASSAKVEAKPGHLALPAKSSVPYQLTDIHSTTSLSLVNGSGDLALPRDDKLKQNTLDISFKLTATAATAGHRLLVHHACRFGQLVVARDVLHEDVSTGPGPEQILKLDAMKASQSGTAKSYSWLLPPGLGMATACEATFYDVPLAALQKELHANDKGDKAMAAARTEIGTVCATFSSAAKTPSVAARPCNEQELPRTLEEPFAPPKVHWHKEGLVGWYAIGVTTAPAPEEHAWQRLLCRAGAEESSTTGWLTESGDIAHLRAGESAVEVFGADSPFMTKEDAACELALGIDKRGALGEADLMKATAKASYCITRKETKEGPCPPANGQ